MSVARWLETDSLSNQNIASGLAIGAASTLPTLTAWSSAM